MPTPKQMEKLATEAARKPANAALSPDEPLPVIEYRASLAAGLLHRCGRTIEIQTADAVRLYGPDIAWKDVGQRLLEDTCQVRTGRHEENGCWPLFE
jgi:hypothetical protein